MGRELGLCMLGCLVDRGVQLRVQKVKVSILENLALNQVIGDGS